MNDDAKAAVEWARGTVESHDLYRGARDERDGSVENMRAILAHIDGEPARIAAAVADASSAALRAMSRAVKAEVRVAELERTLKERDEQSLFEGQREHEWNASFNATVIERAEKAEAERDALRARVAELEAQLAEWAEKDGNSPGYNLEKAKTYGRIAGEERQRAKKAEAERDALRARVFEVEQRQVGYVLVSFASHEQWKAELAELGALRAQVEAARTYARQALDYGEDCDATDLLAAMDEAKP